MPVSARTVVDFPLPERPTNPQELPAGIVRLMSLKAGLSASQEYEAVRLENTMLPCTGQPSGGSPGGSLEMTTSAVDVGPLSREPSQLLSGGSRTA